MSEFDINHIRRLDGGLLLVFRELLLRRRASEVATRLGLSPSAVSHALTRLRDLFSDPLFIRRPHGFDPTARALQLGPEVDALLEMAASLGQTGGFDAANTERLFRISAPEFFTALIGARLIERLRVATPGAGFEVAFLAEERASDALRQGQLDLAIGRFSQTRPGFTNELLYEDRYCVVARRGHPAIQGEIDFETYRNIGHVLSFSRSEAPQEEAAESRAWIAEWRQRTVAMVPHWLTALVLVAGSDAIATVPRRLAERQALQLGLQVLDPPFKPNTFTVSALRRAGGEDAGLDWFLDQVRAAVAP
ncbi:LysR family transcriptional regulator [Phenylobacterium sp.]|uniref:LysR family transcriptional regulator n=1 Tax=Phenylobacterium sp. TaxID=1871053 RepID=UPI0030F413E9